MRSLSSSSHHFEQFRFRLSAIGVRMVRNFPRGAECWGEYWLVLVVERQFWISVYAQKAYNIWKRNIEIPIVMGIRRYSARVRERGPRCKKLNVTWKACRQSCRISFYTECECHSFSVDAVLLFDLQQWENNLEQLSLAHCRLSVSCALSLRVCVCIQTLSLSLTFPFNLINFTNLD